MIGHVCKPASLVRHNPRLRLFDVDFYCSRSEALIKTSVTNERRKCSSVVRGLFEPRVNGIPAQFVVARALEDRSSYERGPRALCPLSLRLRVPGVFTPPEWTRVAALVCTPPHEWTYDVRVSASGVLKWEQPSCLMNFNDSVASRDATLRVVSCLAEFFSIHAPLSNNL